MVYLIVCIFVLGFIVSLFSQMANSADRSGVVAELDKSGFHIDKQIAISDTQDIFVDDIEKQIVYRHHGTQKKIPYKDILGYELSEDGSSIAQGKIGGAIVGGLLFGVTGAIVGSAGSRKSKEVCNNMNLVIQINDLESPILNIPILKSETEKKSCEYKTAKAKADELLAVLRYVEAHAEWN